MSSIERIPGQGPVLFTCEHASEELPAGYEWPELDKWLIGTHWAFDLGAASLTRELADALGAPAILSQFSRLLADPNRPEDSPTLFRRRADGKEVHLNLQVDEQERARRLSGLYRPYHQGVSDLMGHRDTRLAFSVHTFTPVYEGDARSLEVGVLYNHDESAAVAIIEALRTEGFETEANEPYSGKAGLMYCVDVHATTHGRMAIEIEVRQDLAVIPEERARLVRCLAPALLALAKER